MTLLYLRKPILNPTGIFHSVKERERERIREGTRDRGLVEFCFLVRIRKKENTRGVVLKLLLIDNFE